MKNKSKKPSQLRAYLAITWYAFRAQTRNPATFAFGFIFPIVFISIFGLIGGSGQTLTVGIPKEIPDNQFVKVIEKQSFIKVEKSDEDSLNTKLKQGKLSGIIKVQQLQSASTPRYKVEVLTSTANPIEAQTLVSTMRGIVDQSNLQLADIKDPPIILSQKEVTGRKFRYIDFALPGQIGFSLLSTAIFGTVFGLIYLKKALILKRMFATPTRALTILLGQGTSRLIIALLQTCLILGVGIVVFKFYLPHGFITFLELLVISTIGLVAFLGFGYFMSGLANDENSAGPLVNLVTLPQFLLSGTFFPTDSLPGWLQPIANNLPLSYFNMAIRKVTTEGGFLPETWPYLVGLVAWGAVMYILAARTFRWE